LITGPALAAAPLYDPLRDFVPVAPLARATFVLVVATRPATRSARDGMVASLSSSMPSGEAPLSRARRRPDERISAPCMAGRA